MNNTFNKDFSFDSGRQINNGNLATICEITIIVSQSDNERMKACVNSNIKWKEFYENFAKPIKEKFLKGIQFSNKNPFANDYQNSSPNLNSPNDNTEEKKSETMLQLINRCRYSLSFLFKPPNFLSKNNENVNAMEFVEDVSRENSPEKSIFKYQIIDDQPTILNLIGENSSNENFNDNEYFDNNYWKNPLIMKNDDLKDLIN